MTVVAQRRTIGGMTSTRKYLTRIYAGVFLGLIAATAAVATIAPAVCHDI